MAVAQNIVDFKGIPSSLEVKSNKNLFELRKEKLLSKDQASLVVAVIPAYNEERFIFDVVTKTHKYADKVIVVNDGSSDRTAELAKEAGALVVQQVKNMGKAQAMSAGFAEAQKYSPAVVVCIDADNQHDPKEIPSIIRPVLDSQADVVIGSRFLDVKSKIPAWRQIGQHGLTILTNTLSGTKVTDSQSGFRAFSPKALATLKLRATGLAVESEMQFLFKRAQLEVAEVPISVDYSNGNKRNPIFHGLQVVDSILGTVARNRPLLWVTLPGFVFILIGATTGILVISRFQELERLPVGWAIVTAMLLNLGSVLSISGIILHSLSYFFNRLEEDVHKALSNNETVS